jgi:hypothetical protein
LSFFLSTAFFLQTFGVRIADRYRDIRKPHRWFRDLRLKLGTLFNIILCPRSSETDIMLF